MGVQNRVLNHLRGHERSLPGISGVVAAQFVIPVATCHR